MTASESARKIARSGAVLIDHPTRTRLKHMVGPISESFNTLAETAERTMRRIAHTQAAWVPNAMRAMAGFWSGATPCAGAGGRINRVHHLAHELRGAALFGYPLLGRIADSLCRYIESLPSSDDADEAVIRMHVNACRFGLTTTKEDEAETLLAALDKLVAAPSADEAPELLHALDQLLRFVPPLEDGAHPDRAAPAQPH